MLAKNTYLKREYRRESPTKMAHDLGITIERKLGIDLDKSERGQYNVIEELKTREYKVIIDKDKFVQNNMFRAVDFIKQLDKQELDDLTRYTDRHYNTFKEVNYALRTDKELSAEQSRYIKSLDSSLSKSALKDDIITYRGVMVAYNDMDRLYKVGQILDMKSFTSTSISKEVAEEYSEGGILYTFKIPKGFNKGAYLENISKTPGDEEYLISYNADIFVESVEHKDDRTYITVITIPEKEKKDES